MPRTRTPCPAVALAVLCAASVVAAKPSAPGVTLQMKRMGEGPAKKTKASAVSHASAGELQAKREMSALTAPPGGGIYCSSRFTGWSGDVTCSGMGDCDDQICRCGAVAKTGPFTVVATWEAVDDGAQCTQASAP